jgi:hypothetical protein
MGFTEDVVCTLKTEAAVSFETFVSSTVSRRAVIATGVIHHRENAKLVRKV